MRFTELFVFVVTLIALTLSTPARFASCLVDSFNGASTTLEISSQDAVVMAPALPRFVENLYFEGTSSRRFRGRPRRRARGAIYARFSTKYQASLEDQIRACRDWAAANDVEIDDQLIFADQAVSGKKSGRPGLDALRAALAAGKIDVLIVFATNRLHRSFYKAMQFIQEEVKEINARCVCVRSGVDTDDEKRWKLLHSVNALMDESMLQLTADQVREGHVGLLLAGRVSGTITFGYAGQEIPGLTTRRNRPQRSVVIDPTAGEWVKTVFKWYVEDRLSITNIVVKLRAAGAPPAPRCTNGWTELAVRRLLSNRRYTGWWSYGETKTVWLHKKDYGRQFRQEQPLRSKHFPELRIIEDALFEKTQALLAARSPHAGRKPRNGAARPRILNGLLWCPEHNRALSHGTRFYCPECRRSDSPALFSSVPADLALWAVCVKLSELMMAEGPLVEKIVETFRNLAQSQQRPDLTRLPELERQEGRLGKKVAMVLRNFGETPEEEAESEAALRDLRAEHAAVRSQIAQLKEDAAREVVVPSENEARQMVASVEKALEEAATGKDPADAQTLRAIIVDLTGGRIVCTQQGEARAKAGWLRGTFKFDPLPPFIGDRVDGNASGTPREVSIDFRDPTLAERRAEEVKLLMDQGLVMAEIAQRLGMYKNQVTAAHREWYLRRGLTPPDGRKRRSSLAKKHLVAPPYQALADKVMELYRQGKLLHAIARELGINAATVTQAIRWWHGSRGLDAPDGRARRKNLEIKCDPRAVDSPPRPTSPSSPPPPASPPPPPPAAPPPLLLLEPPPPHDEGHQPA
jgi:DNA invertase Pin-like site-specific DNA recombinase